MSDEIVKNLEKSRRLSFPDFENIILEPEAVKILVHLFIHPGCKSDINLATFVTGKSVLLSALSPHIITAFPSQVASFAKRKGISTVSAADLLECFALDHADAVEENVEAVGMSPSYALAHVLTVGTVTESKHIDQRQLVDLDVSVAGGTVHFSHILVPNGLQVTNNQIVFHHFGVIVATTGEKSLKSFALKLAQEQAQKSFIKKTVSQVIGSGVSEIDYSKEAFFRVDMTGKLIEASKQDFNFQQLWAEEDLEAVKLPKQKKDSLKFSS